MEHEIKCWKEYYDDVARGSKPFEVRFNDRNYVVGDALRVREWDRLQERYTGNECARIVSYLLDAPQFMQPGYVVMGLLAPTTPYNPYGLNSTDLELQEQADLAILRQNADLATVTSLVGPEGVKVEKSEDGQITVTVGGERYMKLEQRQIDKAMGLIEQGLQLQAPILATQARIEDETWRSVVEDLCIINFSHIYPDDPRKTLMELIKLEQTMALDPKISGEAVKLMGRGGEYYEVFEIMRTRRLGVYPEMQADSWHVERYDMDGKPIILAEAKDPATAVREAQLVMDDKGPF